LLVKSDGLVGMDMCILKNDEESGPSTQPSKFVPLEKSDGTSLYLTREVVSALHRVDDLGFDKVFYIVENAQTDHFRNLKVS